jgi:hypothetical protein
LLKPEISHAAGHIFHLFLFARPQGAAMQLAVRPYVTIGVAIVGASVIAVSPVTLPPPDVASIRVAASAAVSNMSGVVDDAVTLSGVVSDVTQFILAVSAAAEESAAITGEALDNLPGEILALAQVVIANPSLLDNAISTVIHSTTAAQGEAHLLTVTAIATHLPPPLGYTSPTNPGLILRVYHALEGFVMGLVGLLPPPLPIPNAALERTAETLSLTADARGILAPGSTADPDTSVYRPSATGTSVPDGAKIDEQPDGPATPVAVDNSDTSTPTTIKRRPRLNVIKLPLFVNLQVAGGNRLSDEITTPDNQPTGGVSSTTPAGGTGTGGVGTDDAAPGDSGGATASTAGPSGTHEE